MPRHGARLGSVSSHRPTWFKKPGRAVKQDEMLCELETERFQSVTWRVAGVRPNLAD